MPDSHDLAKGWLKKAHSDLLAASRTIDSEDGPFDTACFHAQQLAEKSLKAFLAYHGRKFPHTHNLEELYQLCADVRTELPFRMEQVSALTPYAVDIRYDFEFWPDRETAKEALESAGQVYRFVADIVACDS